MNKITTLAISLILSSGYLFSQKIDYDNSSKWFLGFNLGGTWQTTDVANRTSAGYGLTLGKSFNYNYGKRMTFDIRARYLGGNWYGQDFKKTDLTSYTGSILQQYKDSLGFTVNNFQTQIHRLGLELVIHANGVREKSGWDPYIFGGVGLTWHQTYGDLTFGDSTGANYYAYDEVLLGKAYVNSLLDGQYEKNLEGTSNDIDKWSVGFMPSLGIGIGYQVGKRVTIGFEHKTTFTLIDNFDGYAATSKYNDIYHYTSAYLNFRFKTKEHHATTGGSTLNNVDNFNTAGCLSPVVTFVSPAANALISSIINYQVIATINDALGRENITFKQNGVSNLNFTYNPETDKFESGVVLMPGVNTFEITATNNCGSDIETITVNYQNCSVPVISLVSPTTSGTTVNTAAFSLNAMIQNTSNGQGVTLTQNNGNITNFNFNAANSSIQSALTLLPGLNTFVLTSTNACGTDVETITVNYLNCTPPMITVVNPATNGTTVTSEIFALNTLIQHSNNGQGITLTLNNKSITNSIFNNANSSFKSAVTLTPGLNTFVITSTNACGTDVETITINYQNCIAPQVTFINPTVSGTTASNAAFSLSALIQNSNNGQGISLKQNNNSITNFSFNNSTGAFQSAVTLTPGLNTFVITSTNGCGTDVETITVNYQNCIAPQITFINPTVSGTTVSIAAFSLSALIQNSNNGQGISLKQNNNSITNFSFNNATGAFQSAVTLSAGLNTFVITSTNACGTDTETITINYQNCIAPVITFVNPTVSGTTVLNASFSLSALIQNSNNGQGITLKQNNNSITNFSFNNSTGAFQSAVTLTPGLNTFVITSTNACGTDTETITITFLGGLGNGAGTPEQKITICHIPPGNSGNPQTIEIPLSAWPAHQAHGDNLGPCPVVEDIPEEKITICHIPPGNSGNPQTIEIPLSAWPAHQAHGDNLGPCPVVEDIPEEKITICHIPPGNSGNPQTIEIPLSAWPAHQAHGDNLGPCPVVEDIPEEKITICHIPPGNSGNPQTIEIPLSAWPAHQAHGDNLGPCPVIEDIPEEKITICHIPPGNSGNPQTIEIPLSAWPAHQAHGDNLGPCPVEDDNNGNTNNVNSNGNGLTNSLGNDQKITICHIPPGNSGNPQTIEIPLSAWPAHQAHGDKLGPCPIEDNDGGSNGKNGNGDDENGNKSAATQTPAIVKPAGKSSLGNSDSENKEAAAAKKKADDEAAAKSKAIEEKPKTPEEVTPKPTGLGKGGKG